jgi:hypothetical protein
MSIWLIVGMFALFGFGFGLGLLLGLTSAEDREDLE